MTTVARFSWRCARRDPRAPAHKPQPNLGNIMGRIETAKHISGCAAALGTETGKIGYLGPS
ncbi:hypothetical protein WME78_17415 [Sorangium sp. So ce1097]